jgi:hypothetical protein
MGGGGGGGGGLQYREKGFSYYTNGFSEKARVIDNFQESFHTYLGGGGTYGKGGWIDIGF